MRIEDGTLPLQRDKQTLHHVYRSTGSVRFATSRATLPAVHLAPLRVKIPDRLRAAAMVCSEAPAPSMSRTWSRSPTSTNPLDVGGGFAGSAVQVGSAMSLDISSAGCG